MSANDYTDLDRHEFLKALDAAAFNVSAWEARFLESNLQRTSFTPNQCDVIDKMIEKYGGRVKW